MEAFREKINRRTLLVLLILSLTIYGIQYHANGTISFGERPDDPGLDINYDHDAETLEIEVVNGSLTEEHGYIRLKTLRERSSDNGITTEYESNLTISNEDKKANSNIWAKKSPLGLEVFSKGLTSFPIEEGKTIVIEKDGTDLDNDGIEGIENGEQIWIETENGYIIKGKITVSEGEAHFLGDY